MGFLTKEEVNKIINVYQQLILTEPNVERKELLNNNKKEFEDYLVNFKFKNK